MEQLRQLRRLIRQQEAKSGERLLVQRRQFNRALSEYRRRVRGGGGEHVTPTQAAIGLILTTTMGVRDPCPNFVLDLDKHDSSNMLRCYSNYIRVAKPMHKFDNGLLCAPRLCVIPA